MNPSLYERYRDSSDRPPTEKCASLDLPTLLRVLQVNWQYLRVRHQGMYEGRHFAGEVVAIRNRWAHAGAAEVPGDDVCRDLDTLQRFAEALGLDDSFLQRVSRRRKTCSLRGWHHRPARQIHWSRRLPSPVMNWPSVKKCVPSPNRRSWAP